MKGAAFFFLMMIGGGLLLLADGGSVGFAHANAATYVFEKDDGAIPDGVLTALDKLNRKGIVATTFEQDSLDGNGKTPAQYLVPLAAAKSAGLPSLVATNGAKVLKVVKDPKTEQQVLGAVN